MGIWNLTIQNRETFEILTFEGWILNGRALATTIALVPTIQKSDHSKFGHFCLDFKWFLTKWQPFIWISNGWASRFQIWFKIWTIFNPTSFGPFEIQASPDFRSPLKFCDFSLTRLVWWVEDLVNFFAFKNNTVGIWNPDVSGFGMVKIRSVYKWHLKTNHRCLRRSFWLPAILFWPFDILTFWPPSWICHLKSGLFGSHLKFTIWKPDFLVWISNGQFKVAA